MAILVRLKFDHISIIILSLIVPVSGIWLFNTAFNDFSYDMWGHIGYIRYLLFGRGLPDPREGWLFYHPPLYYIFVAPLSLIEMYCRLKGFYLLQLFSVCCYFGLLTFGARIFRLYLKKKSRSYYGALFLLVLWPVGIMISVRVDNNALLNVLCAASAYYFITWYQKNEMKGLVISLLILGLAIMTKTNAAIMFVAYFILITVKLQVIKDVSLKELFSSRMISIYFVLLLCIYVNLYRHIDINLSGGHIPMIVGNSSVVEGDASLRVRNDFKSYAGFSITQYFKDPYYYTRAEYGGKNYFWVTVLKTMLYGEFQLDNIYFAQALNFVLLLFVAYLVVPSFYLKKNQLKQKIPLITIILCSIAALAFNRFNVAVSSSSDFRYVYFALIFMITMFAGNLEFLEKKKNLLPLYYVGLAVCVLIPLFALVIYGDYILFKAGVIN